VSPQQSTEKIKAVAGAKRAWNRALGICEAAIGWGAAWNDFFLKLTLHVLHPVRTFGLLALFRRAKAREELLVLDDDCLSNSLPGIKPAPVKTSSGSGTDTYCGTAGREGIGIR
jgi:hypothetical protein